MRIRTVLFAGVFALAAATLTAPASAAPTLDPGLSGVETTTQLEKAHWRHYHHWHRWHHWHRYHYWHRWHHWHHWHRY